MECLQELRCVGISWKFLHSTLRFTLTTLTVAYVRDSPTVAQWIDALKSVPGLVHLSLMECLATTQYAASTSSVCLSGLKTISFPHMREGSFAYAALWNRILSPNVAHVRIALTEGRFRADTESIARTAASKCREIHDQTPFLSARLSASYGSASEPSLTGGQKNCTYPPTILLSSAELPVAHFDASLYPDSTSPAIHGSFAPYDIHNLRQFASRLPLDQISTFVIDYQVQHLPRVHFAVEILKSFGSMVNVRALSITNTDMAKGVIGMLIRSLEDQSVPSLAPDVPTPLFPKLQYLQLLGVRWAVFEELPPGQYRIKGARDSVCDCKRNHGVQSECACGRNGGCTCRVKCTCGCACGWGGVTLNELVVQALKNREAKGLPRLQHLEIQVGEIDHSTKDFRLEVLDGLVEELDVRFNVKS